MESNKVDISLNIIFRVLIIILIGGFLYLIREVLALLLVAIVITASLNPIIRKIQKFHLSRTYAVVLVYFVFFATLGSIIYFIVPIIVHQFQGFYKSFPELLNKMAPQNFTFLKKFYSLDFQTYLVDSIPNIFSTAKDFFVKVASILAVISMSFYMSLQENGLKRFVILLTPKNYKKYVSHLVDEIYNSFGRWLTGLLVTMFFVGILYYIGLFALGIPFAIILALIGGLLEIIPYFGPIMAGIPAIILGFSKSPLIGFLVLVIYWLINLIENHILIPKIMNKAVGLNPVLIILALLIGAKLGGVLGLFLAVPLAGASNVLLKDVLNKYSKEE